MGKLGNNLSFGALIVGAILCLDQVKGNDGLLLQLTLISILVNGAIGLYLNIQEEVDSTMNQIQCACKALTPALWTTVLWLDNQVLTDKWNYVPLGIAVIMQFTQFLGDEVQRARSMTLIMYLHCFAQLYCAFNKNDTCMGVEAVTLLVAYLAYNRGEIVSGIMPFAQYNYLTAAFMIELAKCKG